MKSIFHYINLLEKLGLFLILSLALSACALLQKDSDDVKNALSTKEIGVHVQTSPNANSTRMGEAAPLSLVFYTLRDNAAFKQASFITLSETPRESLGADLRNFSFYMFQPDKITNFKLTVDPAVKFIGVVAAFRNLSDTQWKLVVPVTQFTDNIYIDCTAGRIRVLPQKKGLKQKVWEIFEHN